MRGDTFQGVVGRGLGAGDGGDAVDGGDLLGAKDRLEDIGNQKHHLHLDVDVMTLCAAGYLGTVLHHNAWRSGDHIHHDGSDVLAVTDILLDGLVVVVGLDVQGILDVLGVLGG